MRAAGIISRNKIIMDVSAAKQGQSKRNQNLPRTLIIDAKSVSFFSRLLLDSSAKHTRALLETLRLQYRTERLIGLRCLYSNICCLIAATINTTTLQQHHLFYLQPDIRP
jgi:hypothetical protein